MDFTNKNINFLSPHRDLRGYHSTIFVSRRHLVFPNRNKEAHMEKKKRNEGTKFRFLDILFYSHFMVKRRRTVNTLRFELVKE